MDTGSTGLLTNVNALTSTTGLQPLGQGSQYYSSSGRLYSGDYYLTPVTIQTPAGSPTLTANVVALLATTLTCQFTNKGCEQASGKGIDITYLGIGFDRGVSAIAPPGGYPLNPLTNVTVQGAPTGSVYSQGYIMSNTGITLGLTNTNTSSSVPRHNSNREREASSTGDHTSHASNTNDL